MLTTNYQGIYAPGTVMNATLESKPVQLENAVDFAIQVVFTGTPTGSFKLQCSCDPVPAPALAFGPNGSPQLSPAHWTDIAGSSATVSAAGDITWNYQDCGFTYVRVVYTDGSSGASTALITSATATTKGV
jgi:hypothetical protein